MPVDFLNKALAQVSDLFRSMTVGARITASLLLVVIVISVAYLLNHQFSSGDTYLFGSEPVAASELRAMEAAFGKKGLTDYELDGTRIRVPRSKQAVYMAALADEGALPHNFGDVMRKMFESSNVLVSKAKQLEMSKWGLQTELGKIINTMPGIESASVLYDVQTLGGLTTTKQITASAQVKAIGNQTLTAEQVQKIRYVVGPAIGASAESVSVVDLNGHTYPGGISGESGDVSQDRYLNTKLKYEQEFREQIQNLLNNIKGAVVSVNVELNRELKDVENKTTVDPKTVPLDVVENSSNSTSSAAQPAGRPGVGNQGAVNAAASINAANGSRTESDTSTRREKNAVSSQQVTKEMAGLTPKHVTASVVVPSNYFEDIWRANNPTPPGTTPKKPDAAALDQIETEEKAKIQKAVAPIVAMSDDAGKDPTTLVTVQKFSRLPTPEIEKPGAADHALVWFSDHASAVGMGFLGMVSLLMVRSIVRSVPAAVVANEPDLKVASTPTEEFAEEEADAGEITPRLRRRRSKSGPSLRDELVEIVREDPDAAANILRSWIGTAN